MDDNKLYFDKEKQQKAINWLDAKWKNRECECCGETQWNIAEFLIASPRYEGGISLGGNISPQLIATCTNCGNTKHFNAVMIGIVGEREK